MSNSTPTQIGQSIMTELFHTIKTEYDDGCNYDDEREGTAEDDWTMVSIECGMNKSTFYRLPIDLIAIHYSGEHPHEIRVEIKKVYAEDDDHTSARAFYMDVARFVHTCWKLIEIMKKYVNRIEICDIASRFIACL